MKPDITPALPPMAKPTRRPRRFINNDAGIMVSITTKYSSPNGSVASTGLGDNDTPTRAAVAMVNEVQESISPWQVASNVRFFLDMRRLLPEIPEAGNPIESWSIFTQFHYNWTTQIVMAGTIANPQQRLWFLLKIPSVRGVGLTIRCFINEHCNTDVRRI